MDASSWTQIAIQLPVVGLFSYVILKLFSEVKTFVSDLLTSHKDERTARDAEWRSWLAEQRESYLEAIDRVTNKLDDHHKTTVQHATEIVQLLRATNGKQ